MRISSSSSNQMSPGMRFFFSRIFPLIFVVVGASVAFFGIRGLVRAKASMDWPTTQGEVVASSVEYHRSDKGGGTYKAEVMYDFSVNETTFIHRQPPIRRVYLDYRRLQSTSIDIPCAAFSNDPSTHS